MNAFMQVESGKEMETEDINFQGEMTVRVMGTPAPLKIRLPKRGGIWLSSPKSIITGFHGSSSEQAV